MIARTEGFVPGRGLRFTVSVDNKPPVIIDSLAKNSYNNWAAGVLHGERDVELPIKMSTPGIHVLKVWMVDPGVVLEKLIISDKPLPSSYFGPPQSYLAK